MKILPYITLQLLLVNLLQAESLKPIMNLPGKVVMEEKYNDGNPVLIEEINDRRKGNWLIKSGQAAYQGKALHLTPPSEEEAKAHEKKNATHTRAFIRQAPADNIISFRFKLVSNAKDKRPPRFFYENGHYKVRINGRVDGVGVVLGKEVKAESDFSIKADTWYETMLEVRGDEVVARFAGGPTLYVKDPSIRQERIGVQLLALGYGGILLDDVVIREAAGQAEGWEALRAKLLK